MATLASIETQLTNMQAGIINRFNDIDTALATMQSGIISKFAEIEAIVNTPMSVQAICHHCHGDGQKGAIGSEGDCPDCDAKGHRPYGRITLTSEE
jgi:hypothetical protein